MGWVKVEQPVEKAIYLGGMSNADVRALGQLGPVVNSANNVYDPPLQIERSLMSLRITKNLPNYPAELARMFSEAVNERAFAINNPKYGFKLLVPKWAAKCEGITGSSQSEGNVNYWEVSYDLLIDFMPPPEKVSLRFAGEPASGWHADVLDRGFHRRGQAGDLNEAGVAISSSDDAKLLRSKKIRITDMQGDLGEPLADPSPLNGLGQPLQPGEESVYLHYQTYLNERSFALLNL